MPPCMRCQKVQPRGELRRTSSGYMCLDRTACASRRDGERIERTRTGRKVSNGDVDREGRLI